MIEIRSYRRVFDLERRIYRIDRVRLNPGGVPLRGIAYFLAAAGAALVLARLPVAGPVARMAPWYLRDLALPACAAALMAVVRLEGRPFHLCAFALMRHTTAPRRVSGVRRAESPSGRWHPDDVVLLPDGSESRMRRVRYTGPGAIVVAVEHRLADGGRNRGSSTRRLARLGPPLTLCEVAHAEVLTTRRVIALGRGARAEVRPDRTWAR